MKQVLRLLITAVIIYGCNDDPAKQKETTKAPIPQEIITKSAITEEPIVKFIFLDSTEANIIEELKGLYSKTPYFTKVNGHFLLYVCNGDWKKRIYDDYKKYPKSPDLKYGIINKQKELVLPIAYDKIYNPDLTAKGFIEIEKDDLLGLFNYETNRIIEPEFEVIFPSNNEAIAIGRIGEQYYHIFENENILILDTNQIPQYSKILKNHTFDALDTSNITYLIDSYNQYYEGDPIEGSGAVVTPSYLNQLHVLPEIQTNLLIRGDEDFGIIESNHKVTESRSFGEKITAFISSFYEEGVDGRGFQLNQKRIITVNKDNKLMSNKMVIEYDEYDEFYICDKDNPTLIFVNDTLMELKKLVANPSEYPLYRTMPIYVYYSFNKKGEMEELKSNRYFDFTKFTKLTPEYFQGCYTQYTEDNKEYFYGPVYLMEHLNINDLDIMRNEIFAEYGYKFKSEKWLKYFGEKDWYSPQYENVDDMLTEIDQHNIDLILKTKERLKSKEKEIVNKTTIEFGVAG